MNCSAWDPSTDWKNWAFGFGVRSVTCGTTAVGISAFKAGVEVKQLHCWYLGNFGKCRWTSETAPLKIKECPNKHVLKMKKSYKKKKYKKARKHVDVLVLALERVKEHWDETRIRWMHNKTVDENPQLSAWTGSCESTNCCYMLWFFGNPSVWGCRVLGDIFSHSSKDGPHGLLHGFTGKGKEKNTDKTVTLQL